MRRTPSSWTAPRWAAWRSAAPRWAALGAAAAMAVAGCGQSGASWYRPGAAALYGNTRITTSRLADEVASLRAGYERYKGKLASQLTYGPADFSRQALTWILRVATIDRLAANEHINVTPAQAQQASTTYARLLAQQGATLPEFAVSLGLPPDMLGDFSRLIAIEMRLENRLDHGTAPAQGSPARQQLNLAIGHLQCVAAKGLAIQVNPQYGVFDYGRFLVVPLAGELASGLTAAEAARLAPRC